MDYGKAFETLALRKPSCAMLLRGAQASAVSHFARRGTGSWSTPSTSSGAQMNRLIFPIGRGKASKQSSRTCTTTALRDLTGMPVGSLVPAFVSLRNQNGGAPNSQQTQCCGDVRPCVTDGCQRLTDYHDRACLGRVFAGRERMHGL